MKKNAYWKITSMGEQVDLKDIKSVHVDCDELQYISSAGLRVLLIMKKKLEGGISLDKVQPAVMEILETTGFDSPLL